LNVDSFCGLLKTENDVKRVIPIALLIFCVSLLFAAVPPSEYHDEKDLPAGTFDGLNAKQKKDVLDVINSRKCDCGCSNGTIAQCRIKDVNCSFAKKYMSEAVRLAKAGSDANQIRLGLDALKLATPAKQPKPPSITMASFRPDDPFRGPQFAKVTIVEFSDFQCPFCRRAVTVIDQVLKAYPQQVKLVFKHEPLSFHPNAMPAAIAAEAARDQGKFWEMHDLIFANQSTLSNEKFLAWADQLHLNLYRYRGALRTQKNRERILQDAKQGQEYGVTGTPMFFINGRLLPGAYPLEAFKKIIDEEIQNADQLIKSGKKLDASFYAAIVEANKKKFSATPVAEARPH
jgi:protein-disulfide isomerase